MTREEQDVDEGKRIIENCMRSAAAIVTHAISIGRQAERERCAKIAENAGKAMASPGYTASILIAQRIREASDEVD